MSDKTKILITRHGITQWNKEGRMQGKADVPLHEEAYEHIRNLSKKLKDYLPIQTIYTSHLLRAIQTGQILQDELGIDDLLHLEDLAECSYGPYEGRVFQEVLDELSGQGLDFYKDNINGTESREDFKRRIIDSFSFIHQKHQNQTVLVVTHGGAIWNLLEYVDPAHKVERIPNSSLFLYIPEETSIQLIG